MARPRTPLGTFGEIRFEVRVFDARCLDVYCQAATTGLIGQEPYLSDARASNARWAAALSDYLIRCGAPAHVVNRIVTLVDSSLYGFHLDLATDRPDELARGVDDLAQAAESLADGAGGSQG